MSSIVPGRRPLRRARLAAFLAAAALIGTGTPPAGADTIPEAACLVPTIDDKCEAWEDQFSQGVRETPSDSPVPFYNHTQEMTWAGAVSHASGVAFVTGTNVDWPSECAYGIALADRFQTVAYDIQSGQRLWDAQVSAPDCTWTAYPRAIAVSADDSKVFVTGVAARANGEADVLVVAHDALTGEVLWRVQFDGPFGANDDSWAIAASPVDDRVVVAAALQVSNKPVSPMGFGPMYQARRLHAWIHADTDIGLLTFDGSTGSLLDETIVGGDTFTVDGKTWGSWDFPTDVAFDADGGRLTVAAATDGRASVRDLKSHLSVMTFVADGSGWAREWTRELGGASLGLGRIDDAVAVAGLRTAQSTTSAPYGIGTLDAATGESRWTTMYDVGGNSGAPRQLVVDDVRDRVVVGGLETSRGGAASVLVLDSATGSKVWSRVERDPRTTATIIFNYDSDDFPYLAVDPVSGDVRLVHTRDEGSALRTVSYAGASGDRKWTALYHFPERSGVEGRQEFPWPQGIAVAHDGSTVVYGTVFVQLRDWCAANGINGLSFGGRYPFPCTRDDFLTIAYRP